MGEPLALFGHTNICVRALNQDTVGGRLFYHVSWRVWHSRPETMIRGGISNPDSHQKISVKTAGGYDCSIGSARILSLGMHALAE